MNKSRIFIAGHKGMVGSALLRLLKEEKLDIITKDREQLDLLNQQDVEYFFKTEKIDQVFLAAAKVGGINANSVYPAEFIYENLMIQSNVIHSAFLNNVKKLLFLGSSCIYPKNNSEPIQEEDLLTGKLEATNEPYAIAKIAGIKMCESYNRQYGKSHGIDYRCVMPTNLYGPGDNYHPENSHVIPGLIQRFHAAKENNKNYVDIWGTGKPLREFLYVDDLASAAIKIMNLDKNKFYSNLPPLHNFINIGSGYEITIKELSKLIAEVVGFKGNIRFDLSKPDGNHKKLLNSDRAKNFGLTSKVSLKNGLRKTYQEFLKINEKF